MNLTVVLYDRAKAAPLRFSHIVSLEPTSYSWHGIGGPEAANITVWGNPNAVWEAVEWLRCPVEITDERGTLVWYGYVAEVEIRVGAITVGVSLDDMANKIAVAYSYIPAASTTPGERKTTAYSSDTDSTAEYGTKELLASLSGASDAQATGKRDTLLAAKKYPVPTVQMIGENSLSASLKCRGWWDTLRWRYYTQAGTVDTATTTQIGDILTSVGEFVTSATIDTASGITSSQYRKGDRTAQQEILDLLAAGTSGESRYLAKVEAGRTLTVYTEPTSGTADYFLAADGLLYGPSGQLIDPHTCPVAFWAKLKDVIPDTADLAKLAKASPFFVQRSQYVVSTKRLTLEAREALSPLGLGGIQQG
mgnify:CR=1 FL=1